MKNNEAEIRKFLGIKEANGQSKHTIRSQQTVLVKLNNFLKGKPFRETTEEDILTFVSEMNGKYAESYVCLIKTVIKSFYRQLYRMKRHELPPQVVNLNSSYNHKKKLPIRPEDVITKEDIAEFLRWCDNFRDKAMVVTLYESAARIGEFININIEHLKFDEKGAVLVIEGKTGQRRLRLIESIPFLQRWIESHPRKGEHNAPLWCSLRKPFGKISADVIRLMLSKTKERTGIKKPMNPHNFRHSRLTELAKFLSDSKLKVLAGWTANSEMVGVYVHLTGKDLDEDLLKIAGVEIEQKPQVSPLRELECPRCRTKNPVNNTFCGLCGLVLDETKAVTLELDTEERMKNLEEKSQVMETEREVLENVIGEQQGQIDVLKTQLSDKHLDAKFFLDEIDELREEIEELKKSNAHTCIIQDAHAH